MLTTLSDQESLSGSEDHSVLPPHSLHSSPTGGEPHALEFWSKATQARLTASVPSNASILRDPDVVASVRLHLNAEAAALKLCLSAIHTALNNVSPISRLPPETFLRILSLLSSIDRPDLQADSSSSRGLGWIRATHVCRRWRLVALASPHLWRHVMLPLGARWAEEMATRAGRAPLCLILGSAQSRMSAKVSLRAFVRQHRSTIQHISPVDPDLGDAPQDVADVVASLLSSSKPAPVLECLQSGVHGFSWDSPETLFVGGAPCLRRLQVANCCGFAWDSPVLRQLTSLTVIEDPEPWHFHGIASALQCMTALKVLELKNCIWSDSEIPSSVVIRLPDLEILKLSLSQDAAIRLLSHMRLPGTAKLSIVSEVAEEDAADFTGLVHALDQTGICAASASPFTHLEFQAYSKIVLRAYRASNSHLPWLHTSARVAHAPEDLYLRFLYASEQRPPGASLAFVRALCGPVLGPHVRYLEEGFDVSDWTAQMWVDVFSGCPSIRTVRVYAKCAEMLIAALAMHAGRKFFLPELAMLELHFIVDLRRATTLDLYKQLLNMLEARGEGGAPLEQLSIMSYGSHLEEAHLDRLRGIVPRVALIP